MTATLIVFALVAPTRFAAARGPDRGPNTIDVSGYPEDMQARYAVFEKACSKCHSLARPINARIDSAKWWKRYVKKMMRKPGSGINPKSGRLIYEFLAFDLSVRKRE